MGAVLQGLLHDGTRVRRVPVTLLQELRAELYRGTELRPERPDLVREESLNLDSVEAHAGLLIIRPVQYYRNGTFDLAADGTLSVIIEALAEDEETVIDLVAWPLERPEGFTTALGYAEGLRLARVRDPATYFGEWPLRVFRTPLAWLKAGCQGVVILREASAFLWLPRALGTIAAEDLEHAIQIARLLEGFIDPKRILAPEGELV